MIPERKFNLYFCSILFLCSVRFVTHRYAAVGILSSNFKANQIHLESAQLTSCLPHSEPHLWLSHSYISASLPVSPSYMVIPSGRSMTITNNDSRSGGTSALTPPSQSPVENPQQESHTSTAEENPALLEQMREMELARGSRRNKVEGEEEIVQESITVQDPSNDAEPEPNASPDEEAKEPIAPSRAAVETGGLKKRKSSQSERAAKAAATKKAKTLAKQWQAPFVLEDPKSPLAKADLRVSSPLGHEPRLLFISFLVQFWFMLNLFSLSPQAILLHPRAWDVLDRDEQREILAFFPDNTHILDAGTEKARPDANSLRNDNNFRHDCARYSENIELGKHDPDWLRDAWAAHIKRNRGDYDEHLVRQFEKDWGVQLPEELYPRNLRAKEDEGADHEPSERPAGEPSVNAPEGAAH